MTRAVVSWIRLQTNHRCGVACGEIDGKPMACALVACWEAVRATGPDGRLIDLTPPAIRCDNHVPASSDTVEHRKETDDGLETNGGET